MRFEFPETRIHKRVESYVGNLGQSINYQSDSLEQTNEANQPVVQIFWAQKHQTCKLHEAMRSVAKLSVKLDFTYVKANIKRGGRVKPNRYQGNGTRYVQGRKKHP